MIICDTMVWYNIGSGLIAKEQIPDEELVFTYVSLKEMASSRNLYKDAQSIKSLQNAVIAVRRYASKYVFDNPFDLMSCKLKGIKNKKNTDGQETWDVLKHLYKYPVSQIIGEKIMAIEGEKRFKVKDDGANIFNSEYLIKKEFIKANNLKKVVATSQGPLKFLKEQVVEFLNEAFLSKEEMINIKDTSLDWNSLELPMETWSDFEKDLLKSGEKFESNDIGDLVNMVYVSKEDKYWT